MAVLATQEVNFAGLTPSYAAAGGPDTFTPDEDTFLHFKNTNAATRDVTIVTPGTGPGGLAIGDVVVTLPATTGDKMIGPFPAQAFADPTTGVATITYSATAGVTVACVRARRPTGV